MPFSPQCIPPALDAPPGEDGEGWIRNEILRWKGKMREGMEGIWKAVGPLKDRYPLKSERPWTVQKFALKITNEDHV